MEYGASQETYYTATSVFQWLPEFIGWNHFRIWGLVPYFSYSFNHVYSKYSLFSKLREMKINTIQINQKLMQCQSVVLDAFYLRFVCSINGSQLAFNIISRISWCTKNIIRRLKLATHDTVAFRMCILTLCWSFIFGYYRILLNCQYA